MDARALNWHNGCKGDTSRNEFIIPKTIDVLLDLARGNIGFFGCATGYIPSQVSLSLNKNYNLHLVDLDEVYLAFAKEQKYHQCGVTFKVRDITHEPTKRSFLNAIVISNTLLEIELTSESAQNICDYLKERGKLIIFTPDVLTDVVREDRKNNKDLLSEFSVGAVSLENKIDRFTRLPYPFYAHRTLYLISSFLNVGLKLETIEFGGAGNQYIMLVFVK